MPAGISRRKKWIARQKVGIKVYDYWESGGKALRATQPQWSTSAIINRAMTEALWPGQDAVGKVFPNAVVQPVTVVGVVGDEKYDGIREPAAPEVYFPVTEELTNKWYPPNIVVETGSPPEGVISGIRTAVRELDTELSLFRVRTMQQVISDNMQDTTLQTMLLGSFAVLGLLLSAVGIYGVMAYLVTQRTHEIGLRVALGAQQGDVLQLVVSRASRATFRGVSLGVVLALALVRLLSVKFSEEISKELFGVTATDPLTFVCVSLLLTLVALAACYIPARRAMRLDPLTALRYQ